MAETNQSLQTLDALSSVRGGLASEDGMARLKALELCQRLQLELETPGETLFRTFWAQTAHHWILFAALDLNIPKILSEDGESPKTNTQIAKLANAEPVLIGRLMRHMASMGTVAELGPDTFAHTKFSRYLLTDAATACLTFMRYFQSVTTKAPEYLAQHNYVSPTSPQKAPYVWANGLTDTTFFGHLSQEPKYGPAFAGMMRAESEGKPTWSDGQLYPVKEKLTDVEDSNGALVVDIGAGNGQDLEWFHKNHPDMKGRLILQDLPYITDSVKLDGIEAMAHNFYDEQPVKGAQVYILHQIIHDYDDETCLKILRAIIPAMKPGYSKLLINELVLPDKGAHWFTTALDIQLMLCLSARERTRVQFMELVEKVGGGLRVEKIWTPPGNGMLDSLIECTIDP